jgi:tetratricopeptide (TPR) repeat protein
MTEPLSERDEDADFGWGESSRFAAHLDRGWALLDRGDLEAARTSVQHAQEVRPDEPDAWVLLGAIALAAGDAPESLRCYERALELDPDYLEPHLAAAQVCLFDLDDPGAALQWLGGALEIEGLSPFELAELELLAAECELVRGDQAAARERLGAVPIEPLRAAIEIAASADALAGGVRDDDADSVVAAQYLLEDDAGEPLEDDERVERTTRVLTLALRLARMRIEVGALAEAVALLRRVCELFPDEPDAWNLLGDAELRSGDAARGGLASVRALELDARGDLPEFVPSPGAIHRRIVTLLARCPDPQIRGLVEDEPGLQVIVRDLPPAEIVLEGADPRAPVLALAGRGGDEAAPVLVGLAVYLRNLARMCQGAAQLDDDLRAIVLDELAHFFGFDEARRAALGAVGSDETDAPKPKKSSGSKKPKRAAPQVVSVGPEGVPPPEAEPAGKRRRRPRRQPD